MESSRLKITDLIRRGKRIQILTNVKCLQSCRYIRLPSLPDHEKLLKLSMTAGTCQDLEQFCCILWMLLRMARKFLHFYRYVAKCFILLSFCAGRERSLGTNDIFHLSQTSYLQACPGFPMNLTLPHK